MGLAPEHHQYDIQDRTTQLSADLPDGVSAAQFARLTGVPASARFMHETLNAVGEAATLERVVPDAETIAQQIAAVRARRRPVPVVACDGRSRADQAPRPTPGKTGAARIA